MTHDLPPPLFAAGALIALLLTVREARRVQAGDRRARAWFAFFLVSAALMTAFGVDGLLGPETGR